MTALFFVAIAVFIYMVYVLLIAILLGRHVAETDLVILS